MEYESKHSAQLEKRNKEQFFQCRYECYSTFFQYRVVKIGKRQEKLR